MTYRTLKLQFNLDDQVEALKEELLYSHSEVVDEQSKGLVWTDDARGTDDLVNAMGVRFEEAELHRLRGELLLARGGAALPPLGWTHAARQGLADR